MNSNNQDGTNSLSPMDQFEKSGAAIAANRPDLLANISTAQQKVLSFLLAGLTEPQIAERIARSRHTVHDHTKAIYSALKVNNRVQLVLLFSTPAPLAGSSIQASGTIEPRTSRLATPIAPTGGFALQARAG
jgi:DNA-binding NarL/FixJ family response regulator